jgi:flavodoxin
MILVRYHSQEHGNTKLMAKAAAEGAREAGADVTLVNTNTVRLDPGEHRRIDAVAFGTPWWTTSELGTSFESSPVWYALVNYFRTGRGVRELSAPVPTILPCQRT